ncbi:MAG: Transcriptional regulatory protein ZraR [Thermoanaerobaculia bacterium]|nr:Transcriptional regulatory protein ZraR [Thermoanaerobaculia bacterium]
MARILVIDDDMAIREMVALALTKSGHTVVRASGVAEARRSLEAGRPDLVVSDIYMPGETGVSFLAEVRQLSDPPPMILMTARGTVETAAIAARTGAFDYLAKPFDVATLLERVRSALAGHPPKRAAEEEGPETMIVGSHPAIVAVYKAVARVAPLKVPVLIHGETGTGKELVARALHRFGARSAGPFVPVHCGAIPDTLIESELFGHRRGAFTDAHRDRKGALSQADSGTVFLDEIGEISPMFQVKLLRFLEDGVITPLGAEKGEPVNVRVVAATHRDVRAMVGDGRFRQDLFFRLAGYEIRIPPLRERIPDLPLLVSHLRKAAERDLGLEVSRDVSADVLARLSSHLWPGNVRELAHVVRRLLIDSGGLSDAAELSRILESEAGALHAVPSLPAMELQAGAQPLPLDEAERRYVQAVLDWAGGNKSEAARVLGIERKTLARKLNRAQEPSLDETEGEES